MPTTTLTFGEVAENGPGMQKLGVRATTGLSYEALLAAKQRFEAAGCRCELVDLVVAAGVEALAPEPAYILIVHNGVAALCAETVPAAAPAALAAAPAAALAVEHHETTTDNLDEMLYGMASDDPDFVADLLAALSTHSPEPRAEAKLDAADAMLREQAALVPDKKAVIRGTLKNKKARWNLTFGDTAQEPDYEVKKGTVVPFASLPLLARARERLEYFFGNTAVNLRCEANYYYDKTCGIGFHGDGERRIVIAVRLGDTMPLVYQWYLRHAPQGKRVDFNLKHGTAYAMSSKAVGTDWMSSSFPTLRHAAGAAKYLAPKK